jgi:hypothetical protein
MEFFWGRAIIRPVMNRWSKGPLTEIESRRSFLKAAVALSGAHATFGLTGSPLPHEATRQQAAFDVREQAALSQCRQPAISHPTNGDEASLPACIGRFTKGLPHTQLGKVKPGTYESGLYALSTGLQSAFESLTFPPATGIFRKRSARSWMMTSAEAFPIKIRNTPPKLFVATSPLARGRNPYSSRQQSFVERSNLQCLGNLMVMPCESAGRISRRHGSNTCRCEGPQTQRP